MGKAIWTEAFPEQVRNIPTKSSKEFVYRNQIRSRKPPNKVSSRRASENRDYSKSASDYKKRNPQCKAQIAYDCTGKTVDVHHMRGKVGRLLNDKRHWLPVCRNCHNYIGQNPERSRVAGLICKKGFWNTPDES